MKITTKNLLENSSGSYFHFIENRVNLADIRKALVAIVKYKLQVLNN